jgi:VanZ family protein
LGWTQLVFLLYVASVTVLSLMPGGSVSAPGQTDKIAHFLASVGMAFLALLAFQSRAARTAALIFVVALGLALEWAQLFVDGRSTSFLDAAVNVLGVAAGVLLFRFYGHSLAKRIGA